VTSSNSPRTPSTPSTRGAILLVGGMGTRLQPLTWQTPKPMLPVAGVPFTEHQILKARDAGIKEIVLATSFKAELFEPYFGSGERFGITIKYAVEKEPLGTGGAIRNAATQLTQAGPIAIFNGDVLSGHDLDAQFEFHAKNRADVTLYLTQVADARAFGVVEMKSDFQVTAFNEKMANPPSNTINAGCYIFNREVIDKIPPGKVVSVERETFPGLLASGARVFGFVDSSYWLDIGTPAALLKASQDLLAGIVKSAATPNRTGDFLALENSRIDPSALVSGQSVIGRGAVIGADSVVTGSVINDGAVIGKKVRLSNTFVAPGFTVPDGIIAEGSFLGYEQNF
jgi:mannose-1-phosphate guanylyltransferase